MIFNILPVALTQLFAAGTHLLQVKGGTGSVELTAADSEDQDSVGRFAMRVYSGGKMRPGGWNKKEPLVLRVSGMESASSIPAHRDHDGAKIVGHSETVVATDGVVSVQGLLSADNEHSREIRSSSKNGFPWQSSVGANLLSNPRFIEAGKKAEVNGKILAGPFWLADKWALKEASFVSLGADEDSSAVAAAQSQSEDQMAKAATTNTTTTGTSAAEEPAILGADVDSDITAYNKRFAANQKRIATVQAKFGDYPDLAVTAIEENWDEGRQDAELRAAKVDALQAMRDGRSSGPAIHSFDSEDLNNCDVVAARLHRQAFPSDNDDFIAASYGEKNVELSAKLPQYVGLRYLCYKTIEAAGGYVDPRSHFTQDTFDTAVRAEAKLIQSQGITAAAEGGFSTFSLAGTLSNLANKRLMAVYSEWPSLVSFICGSPVTHTDFKERTAYRLEGDLELKRLAPTGEIELGTLSEEIYRNQVFAYARRFSIDQQTFINDDLNAFSQLATLQANAAMRTRDKVLFTKMYDPALVGSFYSSAAGNKQNHFPAAALDEAGLETVTLALRSMKSTEGNPTMIQPRALLVAGQQDETARKLLNFTTVRVADQNQTAGTARSETRVENQFRGRYPFESSPWLDTNSGIPNTNDNIFFLLGDSNSGGPFEHAQLIGQESPITGGETMFLSWGFGTRIIWSFGFAEHLPEAVVRAGG